MRINRTLIFLACLALLTSAAWAVSSQTGKMQSSNSAQIIDTDTYLDINSLLCFVYNDGNFAYDNANWLGKTDGLYFPRGTKKTVIYAAGVWVGAKVNGENRLAIAEYSSEFTQGPMENGTFLPDAPEFKVYKIQRGDTPASNPDYANWPASMGAPVDAEGNPQLLGDQMCWSVFNDANFANHTNDAANTHPLGIEIQESTFAYGRSGALGQIIFMKFLIINKGGNTLDSTFISLWADPDLGDASDDLVGCDTTLSVGYCYNEAGGDGIYGASPPAVGFDFFQGPKIETGDQNDSALFQGEWIKGYKNLPMTSFNKYINGTDPRSFEETYNYMKGLMPNGDPVVDPEGDTTKFFVAGDPVTATGWLDDNAADRRYMMSSGPFTMLPGDTQEVVAAIVVGQGADRLKSITALKQVDQQAQLVFDLNFDIPNPPPNPTTYVRNFDGAIDIIWGTEPQDTYQDYIDKLGEFYIFEGYNIYQGTSESGPWTKVATYDMTPEVSQRTFEPVAGPDYITCTGEGDEEVCDTVPRPWDFALLYGYEVNSSAGGIEQVITQSGSNSGLVNHLYIDRSFLDGGPIINNRPYYFAVAPYSVNIQQVGPADSVFSGNTFLGFNASSLEGSKIPITGIPKSSGATLIDTATHVAGPSQGMVEIDYLNYTNDTPQNFEITFNEDGTWNLLEGNATILSNQENQSGDFTYQLVDGLMIRVMGPAFGIAPASNTINGGVIEIQDASGPISPDNVFWSLDASGGWYVSSDQSGSSDAARARFNWQDLMTWESWEFRFTETGSYYFNWSDGLAFADPAPFEIWHYNENDPEPDRQDVFEIIDDDESGGWSMGDRIYVIEAEYPDPFPPDDGDVYYYEGLHLGRVVFNDNGGGVPETGVIVRFNSTIPNTAIDTFTFVTKPVGSGPGTVVPDDLSEVKAVPNPYYNYSVLEADQFDRMIKFTNLPPAKCTIRIFNIAGDLVRELVKDNLSEAEMVWDVKTTNGLYVASGIYVYYIEAEGIGTTYGKMIVFTEVELLNTY
jgi:hypothetical protein